MTLNKNMRLELTVESFGAQGEGICRYEGMAVFVARALPGERILAQITKVEKRYAYAHLVEVLEPSPDRIVPVCPYEKQCGGCVCQHMSYEAQLCFKREQVQGCISHIAGLDVEVQPVLGADHPWKYRNKISMPVAGEPGNVQMGYYAQRSHRVVDVHGCLLAREPVDIVCETVREWINSYRIAPYHEETHKGLIRHVVMRINRLGEAMVVLVANGDALPHAKELQEMLLQRVPKMVSLCLSVNKKRGNVILGDRYSVIWGQERLRDELCGNAFLLSPLSFFQVNPEQTEKLYATALEFAQLSGNELVADVYCGAGTISLMLARKARKVIGIEVVPDAIRDAKHNAKINGVENAGFHCGTAETVLPQMVSEGLRPDVIVLDPPRKGAEAAVLEAVAKAAPVRVVYVSCNPATQARDAKILCEMGYQATKCQPVDMFCHTAGVENVMLFEKI